MHDHNVSVFVRGPFSELVLLCTSKEKRLFPDINALKNYRVTKFVKDSSFL
jgi:hypothetical protein